MLTHMHSLELIYTHMLSSDLAVTTKKPGKVNQMFGTYNSYVILNILESTAIIIIETLTNVSFTGFTAKHFSD